MQKDDEIFKLLVRLSKNLSERRKRKINLLTKKSKNHVLRKSKKNDFRRKRTRN